MSAERSIAVVDDPLSIPVAIPEGRYRPAMGPPSAEEYARLRPYSEDVANSKLFKNATSPAAALMVMRYGFALGVDEFTALTQIYWIEGTPTASAGLMNALITRDHGGDWVLPLESSATACRVRFKRREWADYQEAGVEAKDFKHLLSKTNWQQSPEDMLWARLISRIARRYFADTIKGLYTREEIDDARAIETPGRVVEQPAPKPKPATRPKATTPTAGATDDEVAKARRDAEAAGLRKSVAASFRLDPAAKAAIGDAAAELLRRRWGVEDTTGLTAEQIAEVRVALDRPGTDGPWLSGQLAILDEAAASLDGLLELAAVYAEGGIDDAFLLGALAERRARFEGAITDEG